VKVGANLAIGEEINNRLILAQISATQCHQVEKTNFHFEDKEVERYG